MRIAIVINKSWNIYNFRMGLIKAFLNEGHEVFAVAPEDDYSALLVKEGCQFIPLKIDEKGSNPLKDIFLLLRLYKIYRSINPDAILQYTIKPNIYGTLAAKLLGIATINNVSGLGTVFLHNNYTSKIAQTLYRISFKYPSKVFFQNKDDQQLFLERKLIKRQLTDLLPGSGVNILAYKPKEFSRNENFTFLLIARLLYDKGIVEFAEAARELKSKGINARFQLLGFTDFKTRLGISQDLLENWVSENIIEYLGTTDNVCSFINNADCVVLPSYREGTPRTLLEAASLGKPLIATDVPGCREVVEHDYNGYLCNAKDSADLGDKMLLMLKQSNERLIYFGKNSREKVERNFDERIVFKKYFQALGINSNNL